MKYLYITLLFPFFLSSNVTAQSRTALNSNKGDLYLGIRSTNFFKNNEYYSPVIEGYTLVGYFFQPTLEYSPTRKVRLKAGVNVLDYAGANGYPVAKPVFSTTYNFSERTSLTLGTLNGSDTHRMADPLFNSERQYTDYSENGLQFTTRNEHIFSDTWIDWEHYVFKGDTTREILTFGQSFNYSSGKIADIFTIKFPVQIQAKHRGGQISNYPEPVETFLNFAAGPGVDFDIMDKRLGTVGIDYMRFVYKQIPERATGISDGYADWLRLHYTYRSLYFMTGYWKSKNFYAPNGNGIYSSVSDYIENEIIPERKILTCSVYYTKQLAGSLELFAGLDVYYDLVRKRADTSLALHLSFDGLIHLLPASGNERRSGRNFR